MLCKLYLRSGTVYLPTVARTEAGYYIDSEPVEAVSINDAEALRRAIKNSISKGNPVVPTPTRAASVEPVVLKYARVESWPAFEKGTLLWRIVEKSGNYHIKQGRKRLDKGWEDDPAKTEALPSGSTLDDVAKRTISIIQESGGINSA
jgi:hypothetical protein